MFKYKQIFFLIAYPTKDAGSIKEYFINNSEEFISFHYFPGYSNDFTYIEKYQKGKKIWQKSFTFYKGKNRLIKNISDYIYFSYTLLFIAQRRSYIITNAPIYCLLSSFFSLLKSFKFVLWIADYYPQKAFPMNIYHKIVEYYNRNLLYILYLSPPLQKIYSKYRSKDKFKRMVPLGIKREDYSKKRLPKVKLIIGFIGIIREQQGLNLALRFLQNEEDCTLEIVGDGYKLQYYKSLAKKLGVDKKVRFYGRVDDVSAVFSKWDIGIALYEEDEMNLSYYCEPTKIKHYLSYGIPVITTRTTYFSDELASSHAGEVIDENVEALKKSIKTIRSNYKKYLNGVESLVSKYEYETWYDKNLKFLK